VTGDERDPHVAQPEPHIPPPLQRVAWWTAPAWVTSSDVDGGLVQHSRPIAEVRLLDRGHDSEYLVEAVAVAVADYLVTNDDGTVTVDREAPEILVGALRVDSREGRRLAAAIVVACDLIDSGLVEQLPAAER
jgi:hypothetical protein